MKIDAEQSETPRTDREVYRITPANLTANTGFEVVNPSLCRTLERELAAQIQSLSETLSKLEGITGMHGMKFEEQLAAVIDNVQGWREESTLLNVARQVMHRIAEVAGDPTEGGSLEDDMRYIREMALGVVGGAFEGEMPLPCRITAEGGPSFGKGVRLITLLSYLARRDHYEKRTPQ